MTAPLTRWAGEVLPPAAAPARRDRAALRARSWPARVLVAVLDVVLAAVEIRALPLLDALAERGGGGPVSRRPQHRAVSYVEQLERDLAAADFSLPAYLARGVR